MSWKSILKTAVEYPLLGFKILFGVLILIFNSIPLFFVYFLLDLFSTLYQKFQDDQQQDLSNDNFEQIKKTSKKIQADYEKMAEVQIAAETDRKKKETSLS